MIYAVFHISFILVYPETRGVPLEEMDLVFGEGQCFVLPDCYLTQTAAILYDDEGRESISLVSSHSPEGRRVRDMSPNQTRDGAREWLLSEDRDTYETTG